MKTYVVATAKERKRLTPETFAGVSYILVETWKDNGWLEPGEWVITGHVPYPVCFTDEQVEQCIEETIDRYLLQSSLTL